MSGQSWRHKNIGKKLIFYKERTYFAFIGDDGIYRYLNEFDLTLKEFNPSKKFIGYSPYIKPVNGSDSLRFNGSKEAVSGKKAVSIVMSEFPGAVVSSIVKIKDSARSYWTGFSILRKGIQYFTTYLASYAFVVSPLFHSAGGILNITFDGKNDDENIGVMTGHLTAEMSAFTGRYADASYYSDGLCPLEFRDTGNASGAARLMFFTLEESDTYGGSSGGRAFLTSGVVLLPSGSPPRFPPYAALSVGHLRHRFGIGSSAQSFAVLVSCAKINSTLFARLLRIEKVMLGSSSTELSRSLLYSLNLTQQSMEFSPDYSGIALYNRDAASILGGYHLIEYDDETDGLKSFFCFIKKESIYSTSPQPDAYPIGLFVSTLTEAVKAVKIDMLTGAVVEKTITETLITQILNQGNNSASGGLDTNRAKYLAANARHVIELYYADFLNDIYVLGEIDQVLPVRLTGELAYYPDPSVTTAAVGWSVNVYDLSEGESPTPDQLTSSTFPLLFRHDEQTIAPIPSGFVFNAWSFDDSLRINAIDQTGLSSSIQPWQIRRDSDTKTVGVFSTIQLQSNDAPETFYVETIGGETTITKLWDEDPGSKRLPTQVSI